MFRQKYKSLNMSKLIELAQSDDKKAIEELIKRIQNSIYATIFYLDPKKENINDFTQEVLLRVAKNIKSIKNTNLFKTWLNQLITNKFYDDMRKKYREPNIISIDANYDDKDTNVSNINITNPMQLEDYHPRPLEHTLTMELNDLIKKSIHKLPDQFRLALVLREFQGLSYEEIAKLTNVNVGTVKSRISRARNKLQEYLKGYVA